MSDEDWEDNLWTEPARAEFLRRGTAVMEALAEHLSIVGAASSVADENRIEESGERLRLLCLSMSEAEFDFSATLGPFGLLEVSDEDEESSRIPKQEVNGISLMLRRDYRVESESEVINAGVAAYSKVWPDASQAAARNDVADLGRALFQIVHAGGVDALTQVEGLRSIAGAHILVARGPDEVLDPLTIGDTGADLNQLFLFNPEEIFLLSTEA